MRELLIVSIGPVLVLFISEFFRYLYAKNEREDRFFTRFIQSGWNCTKKY